MTVVVPRGGAAESGDSLDPTQFVHSVETELRGNILPFWVKHARDEAQGGFFGSIDNDLRADAEAPRGALLTARILWTYSAAHRRYPDEAYLQMARWAYADLLARFWDEAHGGVYWAAGAEGGILDGRKLLYGQAFALYGLSEFHRATGEPEPLAKAIELYRLIEARARDARHGGYFEEFSREWEITRERGRGSAMGSGGQKSQNVHLHMMEAYTSLFRVWPDPTLKENLRAVLVLMLDRMLDPTRHQLRLFFDEDWTLRSDGFSFGHDIEFSWLATEAAELIRDDALSGRVHQAALAIADVTLRDGVDADGGVFAEAGPDGVTHRFKEWWSQAEAAVGFVNAYQLSGDRRYLDASLKTWSFIQRQLVDRRHGEWFLGVPAPGKKLPPVKVGFWKCPYHNGRACFELLDRLRATPH